MTLPKIFPERYIPVKYFLSSYRAFSDAEVALRHLREGRAGNHLPYSEWRIHWVATCSLLRTAIYLFRQDAKICVGESLGKEIAAEFKLIGDHRSEHQIFWDFIVNERNNLIKEYKWGAYKKWLDAEGNLARPSLVEIALSEEKYDVKLEIQSGVYKGKDALEVAEEGATWTRDRIFSAISRAGLHPDEPRGIYSFKPPPPSLIGGAMGEPG
ncbi:hypothetical protein [Leisingera sp. ANG-M1]|uniref:hypothetical protein n=1 Tax=Leisingera sp. ANG-M1 TaxID=1577895 RepID=UPI00126A2628|nr:hypothetical protein [Leisingera sp. ANG-M1]